MRFVCVLVCALLSLGQVAVAAVGFPAGDNRPGVAKWQNDNRDGGGPTSLLEWAKLN
jgi:hypothetical protein